MVIRIADKNEFEKVRSFYYSLIDSMEKARYSPGWKKGIYPTDDYLAESINKHELFIGETDGKISMAMIVNSSFNEGYNRAVWPTEAKPDEVTVIHAFCVHPDYSRQGLAKQAVAYVMETAKEQMKKVIRLDVLEGNIPAENLYLSMGFQYVDTLEMYYEDTGWTGYKLFEYRLSNGRS